MKLLIIDDDPQMRHLIGKIMRLEGWHVAEESDGAAGLVAASSDRPDLILCDFDMEGMNGYHVLTALRGKDATATIPFILLTGMPHVADARQTMELGADDYLTKPFKPEELVRSVRSRMTRVHRDRDFAERKVAALRASIAAALPHGLKTPLNGILGYAQILHADFDAFSREEIRDMLTTIHTSAEALDRAVNRFIMYTELLLLAARPTTAPVAGLASGSEVSAAARNVAARRGRESDLVVATRAENPAIRPAHLTQLVEEIVDNAFKFSSRGSAVTVETELEDNRFMLAVTDRGRGMSARQIEEAGAFIQFDRQRYEQQGIGLGIALARLVAQVNSGALTIASTPGSHTRVTVSLPIAVAGAQ